MCERRRERLPARLTALARTDEQRRPQPIEFEIGPLERDQLRAPQPGLDERQQDEPRRRGGRPPLGSAATTVESVRLDPELRDALVERARRDDETPSSVIRKALRKYLEVS